MKDFNAQQAKAEQGETVEDLRDKGFNVTSHPSIAIQRDELYYSIFWA